MSELDNFWCSEGYVCLEGVTEASPTAERDTGGNLIGYPCLQGYYCEVSIVHAQVCQDGFYSDSTGDTICSSCPNEYFCDNSEWTSGT